MQLVSEVSLVSEVFLMFEVSEVILVSVVSLGGVSAWCPRCLTVLTFRLHLRDEPSH